MVEEREDCDDNVVQKYSFEGGPLDGCVLQIPEGTFLSDIFIGVPAKMDGDEQDSMSGQLVYQYTNCHTWGIEGTGVVENHMGHVAVRKFSLNAINKVFQGSQKITPENQEWIDGVNAAVERLQHKEQLGFDINNDDESDEEREEDGEGWKNK
jgi:hypothetical protein